MIDWIQLKVWKLLRCICLFPNFIVWFIRSQECHKTLFVTPGGKDNQFLTISWNIYLICHLLFKFNERQHKEVKKKKKPKTKNFTEFILFLSKNWVVFMQSVSLSPMLFCQNSFKKIHLIFMRRVLLLPSLSLSLSKMNDLEL